MVKQTISVLALAGLLSGCESFSTKVDNTQVNNEIKECPETPAQQVTQELPPHMKNLLKMTVVGQAENTTVEPSGWTFKSRIDSGATTTSIDARDIKPFERDGKRWVRFNLFDRDTEKTFEIEKPVSRVVEIKRHGAEMQKRFVVKLELTIGNIQERVDVSLTDRSDFTYPVLIGRNFLMDRAVIDVSKKYIAKQKKK